MRLSGWVAAATGLWLFAACAELTPIAEGECGNAVIEAGEDCDRFATGGTCGQPADGERACRFVCTGGASCPTGWACAESGLCDYATGQYLEAPGSLLSVEAIDITLADIDGDNREDLVGWSQRRVFVRPGAGDGRFPVQSDTSAFDGRYGLPSLTDLDSDGRGDAIVGEIGGLTVIAGTAAGTFDPVTHGAFLLQQPGGLTGIPLRIDPLSPFDHPLIVAATDTIFVLTVTDTITNQPLMLLPLPDYHTVDELVALAAADIDTDPAEGQEEVLLAFGTEARVRVLGTGGGNLFPRAEVLLPDDVTAARFADSDGDGRLDVIATLSGGQVAVALGDGAGGFGAATLDARFAAVGGPLAAGDLDGDGDADFVGAGGIYLSIAGDLEQRSWPTLAEWQLAVIADFNRDGFADVAAAGASQTVELLYGGPGGWFTRSETVAVSPPRLLRTGDFDGDRIADLAIALDDGASDAITVYFGATQGPPTAPVLVGRMPHIERVEIADLSVGEATVDVTNEILLLSTDSATPALGDPRAVAVLIGTPDRRMFSPFSLTATPFVIVAGQFTSDAAWDVAALGAAGVSFVQGRGAARFLPEDLHQILVEDFANGTFDPTCALWTAGDVDGDGRDELIGLSSATGCTDDNGLHAAPALFVGRFSGPDAAPMLSIEITGPAGELTALRELTAVDLDLDGRVELLAVFAGDGCADGAVPPSAGLALYPNVAGALLVDPTTIAGVAVTSAAAVNVDYTPELELALTTTDGVFTTSRDPTGALIPPARVAELGAPPACASAPARVVAVDVSRDGLADLTVFDGARVRVFTAIAHHDLVLGVD